MMTLEQFNQAVLQDAVDDFHRAYDCWRNWHNRMSRAWLRECIAEIRVARLICDLT